MSDNKPVVDEIFIAALDLPAQEREIFLDQACAGHPDINERLQKLLKAHEQAGSLLDAPAPELNSPVIEFNETAASDFKSPANDEKSAPFARTEPGRAAQSPGNHIGPYKLLEEIGEGGMGTVWVAQQNKPIKRKVALKLIKAGMDSKSVLARFEAERQALAMMDHPNIARVIDGGMTDQGRPYFAMEYVNGVPLTEYCDQAKLSVKERLELFLPICQAVQHAHQKGIIHRDLKPSNILICLYDGNPVPKVIDFGLAKAMHQSLTEQSLYTAQGMMLGTPLYMSPEQAEHNNLDIDTRSDVYSLGVILYELLTGSTPLEKSQFKQAAAAEMLRLIREVEPPKPSTRLSGSASLPSVAAQRNIDPTHLTRSITGDLDWVVMKALEKERSRRYETANGLAADLQRHLADEPVSASPPSRGYRMRKFVKRNRAAVFAATAIAVALLLGSVGTTCGMIWALNERKIAVVARDAEELARMDAEELSTFLGNVFESPDPGVDGRTIRVADLLDRAADKLETELAEQPERRIRLQWTLGMTYNALGLCQDAIPLQESLRDYYLTNFGPEYPKTLSALTNLANSYADCGRVAEALKLREELVKVCRKELGPEDLKTCNNISNLANSYDFAARHDEALKLREEVLMIYRKLLDPEHAKTLKAMGDIATSYDATGRHDEALKLREEVHSSSRSTLGPEHPDSIRAIYNLAVSYYGAGRRVEALNLDDEAMRLNLKVYGPEHSRSLVAMHNLAITYEEDGRQDEALQLKEKVVSLCRKALGLEHPHTLRGITALANSYHVYAGRFDEALKLREEVVPLYQKVFNPEHPQTLGAMTNLAMSYNFAGRIDEGIKLQEQSLSIKRRVLTRTNRELAVAMRNLADLYEKADRRNEAIKLWNELLTLRPDDVGIYNDLAWQWATTPDEDGQYSHALQAVQWARRANELAPNNGAMLNTLGVALYRAEQWQETIDVLKQSVDLDMDVPHNWLFIAMTHWHLGQKEKAQEWYDKSLAWQTANEAAFKADTELQGFFAEAAKLMAPAKRGDSAGETPSETEPKESKTRPADSDGQEKSVGNGNGV